MFYNIHTGFRGVEKIPNDEIVVFVSSLPVLAAKGIQFVFSDRHAYDNTVLFYSELDDLACLPWKQLQERDFRKDPDNPLRVSRYEAEALVHMHFPVDALLGIGCYTSKVEEKLKSMCKKVCPDISVVLRPRWYF